MVIIFAVNINLSQCLREKPLMRVETSHKWIIIMTLFIYSSRTFGDIIQKEDHFNSSIIDANQPIGGSCPKIVSLKIMTRCTEWGRCKLTRDTIERNVQKLLDFYDFLV